MLSALNCLSHARHDGALFALEKESMLVLGDQTCQKRITKVLGQALRKH